MKPSVKIEDRASQRSARVHIGAYLAPDVADSLYRIAAARERSLSYIIRAAIEQFIAAASEK